MKRVKYALIAALAAFAMLAIACGDDDDDEATATPTSASSATVSPTPTYNPTPTGSVTLIDVCGVNPDPATPDQVQVTAPGPSDEITSPMQVTGLVAAFEAQFNIAIKDAGGNDIAAVSAMSSEGQTLAPFSVSVPFTVSARTPACVWVFDFSEADGDPFMVHQVPVYLLP